MRVGFVSCFDVGVSYGLDDRAFLPEAVDDGWDTLLVGTDCPLGNGVVLDLIASRPDVIEVWRDEAAKQAFYPEMETGWETADLPRQEFDKQLASVVATQPVGEARLTIYAIGTVFLHVRFDRGIDEAMMIGVIRCYEHAAYRPEVAFALHTAAVERLRSSLREMSNPLTSLSARRLYGPEEDERGYVNLSLLEVFKPVIELVDEVDRGRAEEVYARLQDVNDAHVFPFAYHGLLHAGDESFVLEARSLLSQASPGWNREEDILRMFACVQIATVAHSTVWAFEVLIQQEVYSQVDGYLRSRQGGKSADELNRLRTLALAAVFSADPGTATSVGEDRTFYRDYALRVGTQEKRDAVVRTCDLAYNIQAKEAENRAQRRQALLNGFVLLLTAVTLLSVSVDAYSFVGADQSLISNRGARLRWLILFVVWLGAGVGLLIYLLLRSSHRHLSDNGEAGDLWDPGYADPTSRDPR